MKTKSLYAFWLFVFYMCLLSSITDCYELANRPLRRKNTFKIASPKRITDYTLTTGALGFPSPSSVTIQPPQEQKEISRSNIKSPFAYLPDVSLTCSTSNFVLRVKTAFYGLGASVEELKIGTTCKSNGVLLPYGVLLFTYPLTDCDVQHEMISGYLVYKFVLHYEPSPQRSSSRINRINVNLECRFQRHHHVHQLAVRPTWQTVVMRKSLTGRLNDFQIQLMDDSWAAPVQSPVYHLGQTVNFQVSGSYLPTGGKLYISSCYATPDNGLTSSPIYTIIDNFGCLRDSRGEAWASQFVSPRTDDTLRFSLGAFQFTSKPDAKVHVHCMLVVTSEDPGPAHKSCTYRANRWSALVGDDSICDCCEAKCVTSKQRRDMKEGDCGCRTNGLKGSASTGLLVVSDKPFRPAHDVLPLTASQVNRGDEVKLGDIVELESQMKELHIAENLTNTSDLAVDRHSYDNLFEDIMDTVGLRLGRVTEEEEPSGDQKYGLGYAEKDEFLEGVVSELGETVVIDGQGSETEQGPYLLWAKEMPVSGEDWMGEEEHVYPVPGESKEASGNFHIGRKNDQMKAELDLNNVRVSEDAMTESGRAGDEMSWYIRWR